MSEPQVVTEDGRPVAAVISWKEWLRIRELLENAEDAADAARKLADPNRDWVPAEVVDRILDEGLHPVRAWREHRGLTQEALAEAASVPQPTVAAIESGTEVGTTDQMRALAQAFGISLETLVATI
jgi:ribosome-binding protein aMBF1 (putative translation factor)